MIERAVGAFLLALGILTYFLGPYTGATDLLVAVAVAAVVGLAVALWLRPSRSRGEGEAEVFDVRATRRAVRRGIFRSAVVAVVWVAVAGFVLELGSAAWQTRGGREQRLENLAVRTFAAAHPGFRRPDVNGSGTSLRSLDLTLKAEPKTASPLVQPVEVKLHFDLRGRLTDYPLTDLPLTGVDVAAAAASFTSKRQVRRVLDRLPAAVVATANVELRHPTTIAALFRLLTRQGITFPYTDDIAIYLEPEFGRQRVSRRFADAQRVSWPSPSLAQFQDWVKTLHSSDDQVLDRLGLPPTRALRTIATRARVYGLVLDQATPARLRGFLADPAVRMVQLGDIAYNVDRSP